MGLLRRCITVVVRRGANRAYTARLGGWIDSGRRRHQMCMAIGDNGRRVRTNPRLILHRLTLVTIIIRSLARWIRRAIRLRRHIWELARELLRNMGIVSGNGRRVMPRRGCS